MADTCHNAPGIAAASTSHLLRIIRSDAPEEYAESLAYTVEAMIATARLALDNENSGDELRDRAAYVVEETLSVAQALMGIVGEGVEMMNLRRGKGGAA